MVGLVTLVTNSVRIAQDNAQLLAGRRATLHEQGAFDIRLQT